jgi:hypothetical protein
MNTSQTHRSEKPEVFVGLFERLYQPEWGVRGKPQRAGKTILFIDEILQ